MLDINEENKEIVVKNHKNENILKLIKDKNDNKYSLIEILTNANSIIRLRLENQMIYQMLILPLMNSIAEDIDSKLGTRLFFKKDDPEIIPFFDHIKNENILAKIDKVETVMLFLKFSIIKNFDNKENKTNIKIKIEYDLSFLDTSEIHNATVARQAMKNKISCGSHYQSKPILLSNYEVACFYNEFLGIISSK